MKASPSIDCHTHPWWWPDHATDEFDDEGMAAKRAKMASSPDVFFSPHVAGTSKESIRDFHQAAADVIAALARGDEPSGLVNPEVFS